MAATRPRRIRGVVPSELGGSGGARLPDRAETGQYRGVQGDIGVPSYDAVLDDIQTVRENGLGRLRHYRVPALQAASQVCDLATSDDQQPAAIEKLLRLAVESLGGGQESDAAEYSLGLAQGTKLWASGDRRKAAAKVYGLASTATANLASRSCSSSWSKPS